MGGTRTRRVWRGLTLALAAALPAWGPAPTTASAAILYETRFDEAPFAVGPFTNQDGWGGFGTANATIQDSTFLSFRQAVKFDAGAAAAGQSAKLRPTAYDPAPGEDNTVVYEVDALLTGNGVRSAWAFQFFGPSGGGRGGFNVLSDGQIQLLTPGTPNLPAGIIERGEWQRWAVALNLDTQSFDAYVDGVQIAANQPFTAPVGAFGAAGFGVFNGTATTEVAYFDNFSISTARGVVPEPGVAATVAMIGGWFALRRLGRRRGV